MCNMQWLVLLVLPVARITLAVDSISGSQHMQRLLDTAAGHTVIDEQHKEDVWQTMSVKCNSQGFMIHVRLVCGFSHCWGHWRKPSLPTTYS